MIALDGRPHGSAAAVLAGIHTLLEQLVDPVVAFDLDGRCIYTNPAFRRITGLPREKMVGTTGAPPWLDPDDGVWGCVEAWLAAQPSAGRELSVDLDIRVPGGMRRTRMTWTQVCDPGGTPACALGLLRCAVVLDITGASPAVNIDPRSLESLPHMLDELRELIGRLGDQSQGKRRSDGGAGPELDKEVAEYRHKLRELSSREREVLVQLLEGKRPATIAERLYLSENTVRNHLKSVYRKLGVGSVAEVRELLTPSGRTGFVGAIPVDDSVDGAPQRRRAG